MEASAPPNVPQSLALASIFRARFNKIINIGVTSFVRLNPLPLPTSVKSFPRHLWHFLLGGICWISDDTTSSTTTKNIQFDQKTGFFSLGQKAMVVLTMKPSYVGISKTCCLQKTWDQCDQIWLNFNRSWQFLGCLVPCKILNLFCRIFCSISLL